MDFNDKSNVQIESILSNLVSFYENNIKTKLFTIDKFWRELNHLAKINGQFEISGRLLTGVVQNFRKIQIDNNYPF